MIASTLVKQLPVQLWKFYLFYEQFFVFAAAAAALHSAWIDAYTMFHVDDDGRKRKRKKTNETNSFASFHVIPLSNSKINKFTHSTSEIIFDCVFDFRAK